jgi:hypothetical protein
MVFITTLITPAALKWALARQGKERKVKER